jgi:O-antigen biosynthesis protein
MWHEVVRIYRTIERRFKDPVNNAMSIPAMLGYYLRKQIHARSEKKVLIEVPFSVEKSTDSPGRIAVIVHCFHVDLLDELLDFIANIPYPYRLFVSTDTAGKRTIITEKLAARKVPHFEVKLAMNRGRDIAPKYITFRDVYAECDYFLHLHGKKSPHGGKAWGDRWRKYLLHSLLGSPEIIASIIAILHDARVGLVFPDPLDPTIPSQRWPKNFEVSSTLASRLNISILRDYCPEYPAGSMFWGKASLVRPLLELNLQFEDFPDEKGQLDGELNHAIERMIGAIARAQGLHGQRIISKDWQRSRKTLRLESSTQLPEAISDCIKNEGA